MVLAVCDACNENITNNLNYTHGQLRAFSTPLGNTVVTGSGTLLTVTFKAVGGGNIPIHIADIELGDEKIPPQPILYTAVDGTVQVVFGVGHDVAITNVTHALIVHVDCWGSLASYPVEPVFEKRGGAAKCKLRINIFLGSDMRSLLCRTG